MSASFNHWNVIYQSEENPPSELRGLICSPLASYIDRIFNVSLAAACLRAWGYEVNQKESGDSLGLWLVRVRSVHFGGSSRWITVLVKTQKSLDYLHG